MQHNAYIAHLISITETSIARMHVSLHRCLAVGDSVVGVGVDCYPRGPGHR